MKKVFLWIIIITLAIGIGFVVGEFLYNTEKDKKYNLATENTLNEISYNNTINQINNIDIATSGQEEKIGINTQIIEETYYNDCDHIILENIKNTEKFVNMTKEDLEKKYTDWEIKEFNQNRVVLYKEEQDFCNEHFLVKDVDGYIVTYTLDSNDEILEVLEKTEIATKYLTDADRNKLEIGMKIYTKQNLNEFIEDFE